MRLSPDLPEPVAAASATQVNMANFVLFHHPLTAQALK
jgi:hypothetical protein